VLRTPLLYLSLYLKTHRADYYRLLQEVREHGAWEAWLDFFRTCIADTANQALDAASRLVHQTGLSAPTVNAALADLERFGIVEEVTGRKEAACSVIGDISPS